MLSVISTTTNKCIEANICLKFQGTVKGISVIFSDSLNLSKQVLHFKDTTHVIDVKAKYNVSYEGINQALDEAREMFALGPANREVVIHITSGIYHINFPDRKATINITRAKPQPQGEIEMCRIII